MIARWRGSAAGSTSRGAGEEEALHGSRPEGPGASESTPSAPDAPATSIADAGEPRATRPRFEDGVRGRRGEGDDPPWEPERRISQPLDRDARDAT